MERHHSLLAIRFFKIYLIKMATHAVGIIQMAERTFYQGAKLLIQYRFIQFHYCGTNEIKSWQEYKISI